MQKMQSYQAGGRGQGYLRKPKAQTEARVINNGAYCWYRYS